MNGNAIQQRHRYDAVSTPGRKRLTRSLHKPCPPRLPHGPISGGRAPPAAQGDLHGFSRAQKASVLTLHAARRIGSGQTLLVSQAALVRFEQVAAPLNVMLVSPEEPEV